MLKLLLKNSFIYGFIPQLPRVASFFILPFITPFLTAVDYGIIGIIDVFIGLISAIHFLGFNVVITNVFIKNPNWYKIIWRQLYGFLLLWSVIYIIILGLVIYLALPEEASENLNQILFVKLIPEILFTPIVLFMSVYYRMNHLAWPIALRSLIAGAIGVALNYYLIAHLKLGYMGWIYSGFVAAVIGGIMFVIPFFKELKLYPIFNFKRKLIINSLKVGLPVIPHNYSHYLLNSSDRLIMERLNVSTGNIGIYSLAYTLGMYINLLANAINQAVSPNLLIFIKEKKWKHYQDLVILFQSVVFLTCIMAAIWVTDWMPLLIRNDDLNQYPEIFIIIVMSYSAWPLYTGCFQVVFYFEKTSILWKITTMAGIINLLLNIFLIPIYGFLIAAWTTLIAMLYQSFSGFFFKHYKEMNKAKLDPLFWFIMVIGSLLICLKVMDGKIVEKLIATVLILAIVMIYIFKKIDTNKIKFNVRRHKGTA
ncbi:oligosaccharide flippase family protein [Psychroflexus gondwanensis]|uniref:lipopolysaccharide biosynthesis protein n=1 Tax=Psychroflexus gondwanensis TaxID=251 RepID=UPI0011BF9437|nr:oligosaccharide flippase family protein [Psychroflexus gondwanensis]TXE19185.1 oligosaccharide flippase family protein [Psychroflexus gondwanensis]